MLSSKTIGGMGLSTKTLGGIGVSLLSFSSGPPPNNPPTITGASNFDVETGNTHTFTGLHVFDADNPSLLHVLLTSAAGVWTLPEQTGITIEVGADGTNNVGFRGTITDLNNALDVLEFDPTDSAVDDEIALSLAVGDDVDLDTLNITATVVEPANHAPTITVPSEQTMQWNSVFTFDPGEGTGITVDDADSDPLHVDLVATNGVLTLNGTAGLVGLTGDGTDTVSFDGTLSDINTALNGMTFTPTTDYAGTGASVSVSVDDGHGGTDSDSVTINVQCVRTLVLNTSADFYTGYGQGFKLNATWGVSNNITIDNFVAIQSTPNDTAALVQSELDNSLGLGQATVTGSWDGSDQNIVIVFEASMGVVMLAYTQAQWYPTISIDETVTQQGEAGVNEIVLIAIDNASPDDTNADSNGNYVTTDGGGAYSVASAGGGWTITSNDGNGNVYFTCDTTGDKSTSQVSGSGSVTVQQVGSTGQPEIHMLTPTPTNPTGGTLDIGGTSNVAFDASTSTLKDAVDNLGSWSPSLVSGTFDSGAVSVTAGSNENQGDTSLNPVNVNLTAPEMGHSIT